MARTKGIAIENNFVGGFNSEATALKFPPNSCTDELNCVFSETGRATRRGAFDLEEGYVINGNFDIYSSNEAYTEFLWTDVGGTGTLSFLVQQQGLNIHFFDVSSNTTPSAYRQVYATSLDFFKVSGTPYNPGEYQCQFTQGNGYLLVVNRGTDPFRISYDALAREFTAAAFPILYRDFIGLDDSYDLISRPAFGSVLAMKADANGALHYYNLLNQGWWQGPVSGGVHDPALSPLGLWDAAFANQMPSSADTVSYYRSSTTVPFNSTLVDTYRQGNTPSPKGHFILSVGAADRYTAMTNEGFTLSGSADVQSWIEPGVDTSAIIGNFTNNSRAFDGIVGTDFATATATGSGSNPTVTATAYAGVTLAAPTRIWSCTIRGRVSQTYGIATNKVGRNITARLYAKAGASPASATDGTALSGAVGLIEDFMGGFAIASNDTATNYDHVWVVLTYVMSVTGTSTGTTANIHLAEGYFYDVALVSAAGSLPTDDVTFERPQCVEFFAGRVWYGGIDFNTLSNTLYFSQLVEKPDQFGYCYQLNDPTSEELFDLLPTDGGTLKIPEMGRVIRLFAYQNVLLVFATNGVWLIQGSGSKGFSASDFSVRRISSLGTQSPQSFVDLKGFPVWWGEDGILLVEYNPQFDSYSVQSISEETLKSFYLDIPAYNRRFAKGAIDVRDEVIYWLYDDNSDTTEVQQNLYTKVLCYNTRSKAFYRWEISESSIFVRGVLYVYDSTGISTPRIKYTVTYPVSATQQKLSYADTNHTTYLDWSQYAVVSGDSDDEVDYTSFFISGYRHDAETMKFFQSNYVMTFMEREEDAGVHMQGVWDYAFDPGSGDWTTRQDSYRQEAYDPDLPFRSIVTRRLKVRGRGRALQLKFTSMSEQPFTIIGWSIFETANADV